MDGLRWFLLIVLSLVIGVAADLWLGPVSCISPSWAVNLIVASIVMGLAYWGHSIARNANSAVPPPPIPPHPVTGHPYAGMAILMLAIIALVDLCNPGSKLDHGLALDGKDLRSVSFWEDSPSKETSSAAAVSSESLSSSEDFIGARVRFLDDQGNLVPDKFVTLQSGVYYPARKRLYFWLGADESPSTLEGVTIRTGRADRVLAAHVKSVLKPFAGEKRTGALVEQINADGSIGTSVTVMGGTFHKRSGAIWLLLKDGDRPLGLDQSVFVKFLDHGAPVPTD